MDRLDPCDHTPACNLLPEVPGDAQRWRLVELHRDGLRRHLTLPQDALLDNTDTVVLLYVCVYCTATARQDGDRDRDSDSDGDREAEPPTERGSGSGSGGGSASEQRCLRAQPQPSLSGDHSPYIVSTG